MIIEPLYRIEHQCSICGNKVYIHKKVLGEEPEDKPVCGSCVDNVYEELKQELFELEHSLKT